IRVAHFRGPPGSSGVERLNCREPFRVSWAHRFQQPEPRIRLARLDSRRDVKRALIIVSDVDYLFTTLAFGHVMVTAPVNMRNRTRANIDYNPATATKTTNV